MPENQAGDSQASELMRKQWDAIARENPHYGILSHELFEDPSKIQSGLFWHSGEDDVLEFLSGIDQEGLDQKSLVEIGCGMGRMTHPLAKRFSKVWAFDVSSVMIKKARKHWGHLENVEFIQGNGCDLKPLEDASVDVVFSTLVLQHLPKPHLVLGYLEEAGRVLRPNGIACVQLNTISHSPPDALSWRGIGRFFRKQIARLELIAPTILKSRSTPLWRHYRNRYECFRGSSVTVEQVEATALKAGLAIEKSIGSDTLATHYQFRKK